MGLAICVGMLAELLEDDPEGAEAFEEDLAEVNRVLAAAGLPPHTCLLYTSPSPRDRG